MQRYSFPQVQREEWNHQRNRLQTLLNEHPHTMWLQSHLLYRRALQYQGHQNLSSLGPMHQERKSWCSETASLGMTELLSKASSQPVSRDGSHGLKLYHLQQLWEKINLKDSGSKTKCLCCNKYTLHHYDEVNITSLASKNTLGHETIHSNTPQLVRTH